MFCLSDLIIGKASTLMIFLSYCSKKVENQLEEIDWYPCQSNYDDDVWNHLENNLFKKSTPKHFSKYLGKESILEIILSI